MGALRGRGVWGYGARDGRRKFAGMLALVLAVALAPGPVAAGKVLIAFGDSLTQGFGLEQGAGLVPQLQAWLRAHGQDVTVENAGVSGDTSAGGLSRIGWTLAGGGDAVMVELGGNDLLRGLPPSVTRANLDGILKAVTAKGLPVLLIGLKAPANYGATYSAAFDAIYPDLARKYGAALVPDFFAPLKAQGDEAAARQKYMQADGIHPDAAGVKLIVRALGPEVAALMARAK